MQILPARFFFRIENIARIDGRREQRHESQFHTTLKRIINIFFFYKGKKLWKFLPQDYFAWGQAFFTT